MKKNLLLLIIIIVSNVVFAQKKTTTTSTVKAETKKVTKKEALVAKPVEMPVVEAPKVEAPKVVAPKESFQEYNESNTRVFNKPKNPMEIGGLVGLSMMQGDVNSKLGFNLDNSTMGLYIRKAFGYAFSMRLQYNYHNITMRHDQPHYSAISNGINTSQGSGVLTTNKEWYPSTQMYGHTIAFDNIFNIGNTSLHKLNSKIIYELFAGPALMLYRTKLDVFDANGNGYNWSAVDAAYNAAITSNPLNGDNAAKVAAGKVLDNMLDGKYETIGNNNKVKNTVGGYAAVSSVTFGAAINFLLGEKLSASIEQRLFYVLDDYLDGERWANFAPVGDEKSFSQNNDIILNTTFKMGYFLGAKGTKPMYWQNREAVLLNKMSSVDPNKAVKDAFADDDNDGVPNMLDQELDSKPNYPVNVKGVMLDSDKDGFLDTDDKEPYSPAGYPIDNKGVAIIPPPACCAEMKAAAVEAPKSNTPSNKCAETILPSLKFEKDKYGVNSTMAPSLQSIGEKMQACPDMKLVVNGINDKNNKNGKYNEQLSYNRANEVVNYLSEKFGLSRERFITKYNQDGTGDLNADRAVMFRNAQSGETGASNPPAPHPGLKAGNK